MNETITRIFNLYDEEVWRYIGKKGNRHADFITRKYCQIIGKILKVDYVSINWSKRTIDTYYIDENDFYELVKTYKID